MSELENTEQPPVENEGNGPANGENNEEQKDQKPKNNGPPVSRIVTSLFRTIAIEESDVSFERKILKFIIDRTVKMRTLPNQ